MDKRANLFATVYQQVLWYHQASSQYGKTQGFMVVFIPEYHAVRPQKPGIVVGAQVEELTTSSEGAPNAD